MKDEAKDVASAQNIVVELRASEGSELAATMEDSSAKVLCCKRRVASLSYKKPHKLQVAKIFNHPTWKLSTKMNECSSPRCRKRVHSILTTGIWKQLTEAEKRAWQIKQDEARLQTARELIKCREKALQYIENPRFCQVSKGFKALKLIRKICTYGGKEEWITLEPPAIKFEKFEVGGRYTAHLRLLNASTWSQRVRVILQTTQQFHLSHKGIQGKVLIPGKTCDFTITYSPKDIFNTEGVLLISTEIEDWQVMLKGENPVPIISIPSELYMGCCITGHSSSASFTITSSESPGTFEIFYESGHNMSKEDLVVLESIYGHENILYIPNFVVYPKSFQLQADESVDIIILFRPQVAEQICVSLKISAQTGQEWKTVIMGQGVDIMLKFDKTERREFWPSEVNSGLWFGQTTLCTRNCIREVSVRNSSLVSLKFYWDISKKNAINYSPLCQAGVKPQAHLEKSVFIPHPQSGVLVANSEASFSFTFTPEKVVRYRQHAGLYIDTRESFNFTSSSWHYFRKQLAIADETAARNMRLDLGERTRNIMNNKLSDTATGSILQGDIESYIQDYPVNIDNGGYVFKALEIDLIGEALPFDIQIIPPFLSFSNLLLQGRSYTQQVMIQNYTTAEVCFKWEPSLTPWELTRDSNTVIISPMTGRIEPNGNAEFRVTVRTRTIGHMQERLFCAIGECRGHRLQLLVEAYIQGPQIKIEPPFLDFGLIQLKTSRSLTITLVNLNEVDVPFKIYSVATDRESTSFLSSSRQNNSTLWSTTTSSLHISQQNHELATQFPTEERKELFLFTPESGSIPRKQSLEVKVDFVPTHCGQISINLVCEVADGLAPTQYALARACVMSPEIHITPCEIDLGVIFRGKQISRKVMLHNVNGLSISFAWTKDAGKDSSALDLRIAPPSGRLDPYGKMDTFFSMLPNKTGKLEYQAVCKVNGTNYAVAVTFKCYTSDILCSYHILRPSKPQVADIIEQITGNLQEKNQHDNYLKNAVEKNLRFQFPFQNCSENLVDTSNLPRLDYGKKCPVGSAQWRRLVIRNLTSIPAKVQVAAAKYGCISQLRAQMLKQSLLTGKSTFSLVHTKSDTQQFPFLIEYPYEIDQKYWSNFGHAKVAHKIAEVMQDALIKNEQNITVSFFPYCEGLLEAWGEWHCDIFCYSCLPGSYSDIITCSVGNLPKAEIPLAIEVVGTPLLARHNWPEPRHFHQDVNNEVIVLRWTAVPAGHPPQSKSFWVVNVSSDTMEVNWLIMRLHQDARGYAINMLLDVLDETFVHIALVGDGDKGPVKLLSEVEDTSRVYIRFQEYLQADFDDPPFCITPVKQVLPGHSSRLFTVTFCPAEVSRFTRILYGRTKHLKGCQTHSTRSLNMSLTAEEHILEQPFWDTKRSNLLAEPPQTECLQKADEHDKDKNYWENQKANAEGLSTAPTIQGTAARNICEDPIAALRVCLEASVSVPRLQTSAEDGLQFLCHGSIPFSDPSYMRVLSLKNVYTFSLPISVSAPPLFYIIAAKMGVVHSKVQDGFQHLENSDSLNEFVLPPKWTLQLEIMFFPEQELLSSGQDSVFENQLLIKILEQYEQVSNLHAELVFPRLIVLSETIWFGTVLTKASRTLQFSLINPSLPDAEWFLIKDQLQKETQETPLEESSKESTDGSKKKPVSAKKSSVPMKDKNFPKERLFSTDQTVEPSSTEKVIKLAVAQSPSAISLERKASRTVTVEQTPFSFDTATDSLPSSGDVQKDAFRVSPERGFLPGSDFREAARQSITVTFAPIEPILYRQKFFINVAKGRGCSVTVEGQGIHSQPAQEIEATPATADSGSIKEKGDKPQIKQQQQQPKQV